VQRAIVLLTPGNVHPAGLQDYRSWEAWSRRANAPMHGIDPLGSAAIGAPLLAQHELLRRAAEETGSLVFLNQASLSGIAAKILADSEVFYRVAIDMPVGVAAGQSLYMTVRTHPTAIVRSRLRARVPVPDAAGARAGDELRKALEAPLPMDELPISFAVGAPSGSTGATIAFLATDDSPSASGVVQLPSLPATIAFAALLENGRLQVLGTHRIGGSDLRIEGCCATARADITIPAGAIAVRAAAYQHATGRVGAAFLPLRR
jgi:hypothetical protein